MKFKKIQTIVSNKKELHMFAKGDYYLPSYLRRMNRKSVYEKSQEAGVVVIATIVVVLALLAIQWVIG
jgi:hypothetical protein